MECFNSIITKNWQCTSVKYYPLIAYTLPIGYYSDWRFNFQLRDFFNKMFVTQARYKWISATFEKNNRNGNKYLPPV